MYLRKNWSSYDFACTKQQSLSSQDDFLRHNTPNINQNSEAYRNETKFSEINFQIH